MRAFAQKPKATQHTTSAKSTIPGRAHCGQGGVVNSILHLQRTIGNQAVQRLLEAHTVHVEGQSTGQMDAVPASVDHALASPGRPLEPAYRDLIEAARAPRAVQAKLAMGDVHDPLEREADRVADHVMRMSAPNVSPGVVPPPVSRKCTACENEDKLRKMAAGSQASTGAPDIVDDVLRSPGQPLDAATRDFFEPRFGRDFSAVRVRTGAMAARSASSMNASAYTAGHNIVFAKDQFAPGKLEGQRLIAHELAHVVQQSGADSIRGESTCDASPASPTDSDKKLRRKGFESTVEVCHRVLESREFEVTKGGVRAALLVKQLDKQIPNCKDFDFFVTLTRSVDWRPDIEVGTCEASTGGARSFSFGDLPSGTYYLTFRRTFDHPYCCLEGDLLVFDETISGDGSGCTRHEQLSTMDIVHGALDITGFIPALGAIPDGINAAIYAVEGDWAKAGLSAVAMVPLWGDGVKIGTVAGKSAIRISEKAAIRLGEEGIAKGLKEVKAASRVEKAATEAVEEAARVEKGVLEEGVKAEKQGAKEATKAEKQEAKEAEKGEESGKKNKGGKWTCYGRSAVLQIPSALSDHPCPLDGQYVDGPPISASSEAAACLAAKHAFNAMMPRGCKPKHLACRCSKR
jgi:hypothetical protein